MKTKDFFYELPEELIAQSPLPDRSSSRLMLLDRKTGKVGHSVFSRLPEHLRAGDCLVLNDSRVLPARLIGRRATGGAVEVLLLKDMGGGIWECLTRPGRKTPVGTKLFFGEGELTGEVTEAVADGNKRIRFDCQGIFLEVLEKLGRMPLPPYIKQELQDAERYQTVYAKSPGSAAATTAGLHFTQELLQALRDKGVELNYVTLHVGLGTFRPVKEEELEAHEMHAEFCTIPAETAERINAAKREGRRVICVGTTACRTLEAVADEAGFVQPFADWVNIFIYPGYRFKCTDALITNFHLPESTLIMLVSALAGREHVLAAYREAVEERYRFFSFGDAMFIS